MILSGRKVLVGSYKLKDPIREAKLVKLLCNSFVLRRIKSTFGMEVLWDDRHQPLTLLLW